MSTTPKPLYPDSFAEDTDAAERPRAIDPDDPPWGVGSALFVWLTSLLLMIFVPLVAVVPYIFVRYRSADLQQINQAVSGDPNVLLITIAATVPTHVVTLVIVWAVVTGFGKRPFWPTIGWGWSPKFGFWTSVAAAVVLLAAGGTLAYYLGGEKTPFEQMLESSAAARFATAFLATVTAPLVEELVYRGVLYSALQRVMGVGGAVFVVASLFSLVHVSQYYNNIGVIVAVSLLGVSLTLVRAATRRVLPCIIIHLVFNGVQVAGLIYEYFRPGKPAGDAQAGLLVCIF